MYRLFILFLLINNLNSQSIFPNSKVQLINNNKTEIYKLTSDVSFISFWATWCLPCLKEIDKLNEFIEDTEMKDDSLEEIILKSSKNQKMIGLFNNASQHWNHNLFWKCMKPNGGGTMPPKLEKRIISDFGDVVSFKNKFKEAGVTQFGSGWCWLSIHEGKLVVTKTANAANPLIEGMKPILGCDVWEHSYYIDYRNKRPEYLDKFVENLIDWEFVESLLD